MGARHPLHHESWLAYHIEARAWLRAKIPAFARRAWLRFRIPFMLLAALAAAALGLWLTQQARLLSAQQTPLSLPALEPIPDLTPHTELPAGESSVPAVPSNLKPAPASPILPELAPAAPPLARPAPAFGPIEIPKPPELDRGGGKPRAVAPGEGGGRQAPPPRF
ncbi:hypothetical protein SAMN06265338_103170 [Rhodoblastus acidophilus]|uniref:Uncharacterized protein n=1 Tax=Rhodoblastus acidophilus TaxID=1074 RepID=A0A212RAC3_RHOAC|nr:hypothetical protein [Rhodoblastus acidophilus]PPQ39329.1 hypothetical protein CKO16_06125 [Rhodoblastus acidophilus]RAI22402.1 hypothetical protein CH337_05320 [Rhodoblastus acidophilus]SNB69139.1 hypothetical protein SAMN06265338_103170 [Rhodoblastus acidophilus]